MHADPFTESLLAQFLAVQPGAVPVVRELPPLAPEDIRKNLRPEDEHQSEAI